MKLHFDSKQEYQIDAIGSVIKLFEGQIINNGDVITLSIKTNKVLQMKDANIEFRTV